ncbi:MAG: hypothetical protein RIM23_06055 [Coleofasciculus sp. G3-WIS-01]|uniref:tetratricopeptide repeat protein n=1 Tax=Coleofasciculus sp. G3-WIS-01 TaxID=3069528 RepID=UPI00330145E9
MKHTKLFIGAFVISFTTAIITMPAAVASRVVIKNPNGRVELKPRGETNFRPIRFGEEVGRGDELRVGRGAEVELICGDTGNLMPLYYSGKTESVTEHCPGSRRIIRTGFNSNRPGGNNPQIPYVISPRMTYLLTDKPTLQWNEVEGAASYTVGIEDENGELLWQRTVTSTEIDYPEDEPPLEWGRRYLVTVEASNGASSRNDAGGHLGFEVLDPESIKRVQDQVTTINQNSAVEERSMNIAYLYKKENLLLNAIETLEKSVAQGSQAPLSYMLLGDVYGLSGLNLHAEASYEMAIELLNASQDQYGLNEVQDKLEEIKQMLDNSNEMLDDSNERQPQILTPIDIL